jgi:D-glucosaminate-6-phosphate ammonia-lyase
MGIYEEMGVRPFINAKGTNYTREGGTLMRASAAKAMAEAAQQFVNIEQLQVSLGEIIADMTNNEAAFVSCGAASGIALSLAACMAGTDEELADCLPHTGDMRNQVVMPGYARGTEADAAIKSVGGHIVNAGDGDGATPQQFADAFTDRTAAVLFTEYIGTDPILQDVTDLARERKIPVLVDGACAIPPKENLWHYTGTIGVDGFITSGGKSMRGPQTTGLVVGRSWLIEGCRYHASPNMRIGRGMKVGKEEFAGLFASLKDFLEEDPAAAESMQRDQLSVIRRSIEDRNGIEIASDDGLSMRLVVDETVLGISGGELAIRVYQGEPSVLIFGRGNMVIIGSAHLDKGQERTVVGVLEKALQVTG